MTPEESKSIGRAINAFTEGSYEMGKEEGYLAALEEVQRQSLEFNGDGNDSNFVLKNLEIWLDQQIAKASGTTDTRIRPGQEHTFNQFTKADPHDDFTAAQIAKAKGAS